MKPLAHENAGAGARRPAGCRRFGANTDTAEPSALADALQTDMACLKDAIIQNLAHGYAHHIQRLMVTGLYACAGGQPRDHQPRW